MSSFLYFHPSDAPPSRRDLADLGFAHAGEAGLPGAQVQRGPSGRRGYVFALSSVPGIGSSPRIGYYGKEQEWVEGFDGRIWIGMETSRPPKPLDVKRASTLESHLVDLGDGNAWLVPVVRRFSGEPGVETVAQCGPDNVVHWDQVAPKYSRIWDLAEKLAAGTIGNDEAT